MSYHEVQYASKPDIVYVGKEEKGKDPDNQIGEYYSQLCMRKREIDVGNFPCIIVTPHAITRKLEGASHNCRTDGPKPTIKLFTNQEFLKP
jgi:hypothetical protein